MNVTLLDAHPKKRTPVTKFDFDSIAAAEAKRARRRLRNQRIMLFAPAFPPVKLRFKEAEITAADVGAAVPMWPTGASDKWTLGSSEQALGRADRAPMADSPVVKQTVLIESETNTNVDVVADFPFSPVAEIPVVDPTKPVSEARVYTRQECEHLQWCVGNMAKADRSKEKRLKLWTAINATGAQRRGMSPVRHTDLDSQFQ